MRYGDGKPGAVHPTTYLIKTGWRCCSSVVDEVEMTKKCVASVSTETVSTIDEAAVEEGPKVQVKFVLQKECEFGQGFYVVGNDPLLGNWNPGSAVPMDWEDGHIWSVDMDLPLGKQFEFKFILTGPDGEVEWQPGPNRFVETVEGILPLVMAESWDCANGDTFVEPPEVSDRANGAAFVEALEVSDGATVEAVSVEAPELSDGVTGEALSRTTPQLSGVADFQKGAEEEVAAQLEGKVGDLDEKPPLSVSESGESSATASEIPLAASALAAVAVEAAPVNDNAV